MLAEQITHARYWDCDCEKNYIHDKEDGLEQCPVCKAYMDDQPDSLLEEVIILLKRDID